MLAHFVSRLFLVFVLSFGWLASGETREPSPPAPALNPVVSPAKLVMGAEDSDITVVFYGDASCAQCKTSWLELRAAITSDGGNARLYFKHSISAGSVATRTAQARRLQAVLTIHRDKAPAYFDAVFEKSPTGLEMAFLGPNSIGEWLFPIERSLGMNPDEVSQAATSPDIERQIQLDQSEAVRFGFATTPVVMINGMEITEPHTSEAFQKALRQARSEK